MNQRPLRLLVVAVVMGFMFDFLFWGHTVGINFSIWIVMVLVGGFLLLLNNGIKPARKNWGLGLGALFFLTMVNLRQEPLSLFLALTFTFFSLGVLTVSYERGAWLNYGLMDYFYQLYLLNISIFAAPILFINNYFKEMAKNGTEKKKLPFPRIVLGIVITIPILACFGSLFATADPVFNQTMINFFGLFNFDRWPEYFLRLFIIAVIAYLVIAVYLHAGQKSREEALVFAEKPLIRPFLGFMESGIVLGSVTALFLVFVVIQFEYFFGGLNNIGSGGYSYSQYARRGFNELILVAFLSMLLITALGVITRREDSRQKAIFSGLNISIVAQVMVILVSAFDRLFLAIDWHGFSRLRVYPLVFLIWVGLLLLAVVILEATRRERFFMTAMVLACIGFSISICTLNVDDIIVRYNVVRSTEGHHFNAPYLSTLSLDAVPALVDSFQNPGLGKDVHEGIGAALVCYKNSNAMQNIAEDWQSFNLSSWRAKSSIDIIGGQLSNYEWRQDFQKGNAANFVVTPSHVSIDCQWNETSTDE